MRLARLLFLSACIIFSAAPGRAENPEDHPSPDWIRQWSADLFTQAQKEKKLVLLDMEAVWCHWCHVMDRETYANPEILKIMENKYIAVKIDQDAWPDLSDRYSNWGWPATIIFNEDGTEIRKMRGFINPERMTQILNGAVEKPFPLTGSEALYKPATTSNLSEKQKTLLISTYKKWYDTTNGGWGTFHRFIMGFAEEYAMSQTLKNSQGPYRDMATRTLNGALNLIDPVWGGAYQYSDKLDWLSPHYEKLASIQADFMNAYSMGYSVFGDPGYKKGATDIYRYLTTFMMDDQGAFYTSQNADLNAEIHGKAFYALDNQKRRATGLPRIDKNIYTQNNGQIIEALAKYYDATGEEQALHTATTAAEWILKNHRRRDNGFIHGRDSSSGQYLTDNLSMAKAMLALYQSTGEYTWLRETMKTADYIIYAFADKTDKGFFSSVLSDDSIYKNAHKDIDKNIRAVRFFNLLYHYSGKKSYDDAAKDGMLYLASDQIIENAPFNPGILLADSELQSTPVHIVIIGAKSDKAAKALFQASLALPESYKQVQWYDRSEGKLPGSAGEIEYPDLDKPAAFACANGYCSPPVTAPEKIKEALARFQE